MNPSDKEDSVLKCQKHGQKIMQIVLDNNSFPDDRKEMIKESIYSQNAQIQKEPQLTKLISLQQKLLALRESQITTIDSMIGLIQKWVDEINNANNTNEQIEIEKGIKLLQQDKKEFNILLEQNGKAYLTQLYSSFEKLLKIEGIQECKQEFINLTLNSDQNSDQINVVNKKQGLISYKQINQVQQKQKCEAIAFNNNGNIMVAGFNGNIKVWQFYDGNMNELTELIGENKNISCLIYSKRSEWFVSGDGNLQLWKQGKSNKEWLASNIERIWADIYCIILNQGEDQLISCFWDIIVWQVNYEQNQLSYSYKLEKKHTTYVRSLSLNYSETALVSCGYDNQIILWLKGTDDKWKYQNSVTMEQSINRIYFINEDEFIVQQAGRGYSNIFRMKDKQLNEQQDLKIKLTDKDGDDYFLFPTIYNKRRDVIIQKSSNYVYIIRRETNGQFKVQAQPIDCNTYYNYGSMTEDGQYLVIWNWNQFKIYKLNYE